MSRKKHKNKPVATPSAPPARVFSALEDEFFTKGAAGTYVEDVEPRPKLEGPSAAAVPAGGAPGTAEVPNGGGDGTATAGEPGATPAGPPERGREPVGEAEPVAYDSALFDYSGGADEEEAAMEADSADEGEPGDGAVEGAEADPTEAREDEGGAPGEGELYVAEAPSSEADAEAGAAGLEAGEAADAGVDAGSSAGSGLPEGWIEGGGLGDLAGGAFSADGYGEGWHEGAMASTAAFDPFKGRFGDAGAFDSLAGDRWDGSFATEPLPELGGAGPFPPVIEGAAEEGSGAGLETPSEETEAAAADEDTAIVADESVVVGDADELETPSESGDSLGLAGIEAIDADEAGVVVGDADEALAEVGAEELALDSTGDLEPALEAVDELEPVPAESDAAAPEEAAESEIDDDELNGGVSMTGFTLSGGELEAVTEEEEALVYEGEESSLPDAAIEEEEALVYEGEESSLPEAALDGIDDGADLADPALIEAGDPGDLPEPPASSDVVALPAVDVPELGLNLQLEESGSAVPAEEEAAEEIALEAEVAVAQAEEAVPVPIWTLPSFEPAPGGAEPERGPEEESAGPVRRESPTAATARRFEPQAAAPVSTTAEDLSLDEQSQEAQRLLKAEGALARVDLKAAYWLEIGHLLLGKGQSAEAREAMKESLNAREAFGPALRALSLLARAESRPEELIDCLETRAVAAESDLQRAAVLLASARVRLELGQADQAVRDLEEALEAAPGEMPILRLLETLHREAGRREALAKVLEAMLPKLGPAARALACRELGDLCRLHLGRIDAARTWYEQALELDPGDIPSMLGLEAVLRAGQELAALAALLEGQARRSEGPGGVQAWLRVADLATVRGEPIEAMEALRRALELDPDNAFLRREYQGWLARTGDWAIYIETLRDELTRAPSDETRALLQLAIAHIYELELKDREAAMPALEAALEANPDWQVVRAGLLRLVAAAGDWRTLAGMLVEAAGRERSPRRAAARYFQAGLIHDVRLEDRDSARTCFEEAVKADPGQPIYGWTLRRLLEDEGRWDDVARLLETGHIAWPFDSRPGASAGEKELQGAVAEFSSRDLASAQEIYRQAFEEGARSPIVVGGLMRIMSRELDWDGLADLYARLEAEAPEPAIVALLRWERARLLEERLEQSEEAVRLISQVNEVSPTPFLPALWRRMETLWLVGEMTGYQALRDREWAWAGEPADQRMEALAEAMYQVRRGRPALFDALSSDPADLLALDLHEWYLQEGGDPAALSRLFATRLERPIDLRQARYLQLRRAAWLEQLGDEETALVQLAGAVTEGAQDRVTLDRIERLSGRPEQALPLFDLLRQLWDSLEQPDAALALRLARIAESRLSDPIDARAWYQRVSSLVPDHFEAREALVRLSRGGEPAVYGEMLIARGQHLEDSGDRAAHCLEAGRIFVGVGDEARAEQALSRALEHELLWEQAFDQLVEIYRTRGDVAGLEALYQLWIERETDTTLRQCLVMELADQLEALGALQQATAHFERLATSEGYLPAGLRLERIYLGEQDWAQYANALGTRASAVQDETARAATLERLVRVRAERLHDPWAREQELQAALNADTGNEAALDAYRRLLAGQERWAELAVLLDELAARAEAEPERRVRLLLDAAWVYASRLEDLESAFDRYQDVLDIAGDNQEAIAALKEIAEQRRDWNGMVATLARESVTSSPEGRIENYRQIARLWDEKLGEPQTAVEAWHKVLELEPGDRAAYSALTDLYRRLRQWSQFVDAAERWLELRRDEDPALLNEIGITLARRLDEPDRAVPFLLRALARGQGDLEVMRAVAERFEARSAWREAAELYGRVAEVSPDREVRVDLYQRIAGIAGDQLADSALTTRAWEQVLQVSPDHLPAMWALAKLYDDAGRSQDALRTLDALAVHPVAPAYLESLPDAERLSLHARYGQLLESAGLKEEATAHYDAALRFSPGDRGLLERLVRLYEALGRWEQVARCLQTLIGSLPEMTTESAVTLYTTLGQAHRRAGNLDAALEAFNIARELEPGRVDTYHRIAEIYHERKSWQNLLSALNSIIKYSTEVEHVVDAYLRKADILDEQLSPTDPSYVAKAVLHFEKALQYDRRNTHAMLRLAEIALRGRQFQRAAEWLKRALAVDPTPEQLARIHLMGGFLCAEAQRDAAAAQANFRKAADALPSVGGQLAELSALAGSGPGHLDALLLSYRRMFPVLRPFAEPVDENRLESSTGRA